MQRVASIGAADQLNTFSNPFPTSATMNPGEGRHHARIYLQIPSESTFGIAPSPELIDGLRVMPYG